MIEWGGVVCVPTETVYGLATRPDAANVARIFELKGRPAEKNVQLLAPDASWLEQLSRPTDAAHALAARFWPGPLTLVVTASVDAPDAVATDGTIGIRVPAHPVALDLLAQTGPLAASSANLTGEPTPATIDGVRAVFGGSVDAYLDGGEIVGTGSTVVDLTGTGPKILRSGPLSATDLESVLGPI